MEQGESSGSRKNCFVEELRKSKNSSHDTRKNDGNPIVVGPVKSTTRLRNVTKESQTLENPANLAHLTEEFDRLTRKMNGLKEALKSSTGSAKKLGPTMINSSSQALQIANLQGVFAVKQYIRDCIVELTFVDHFLNGNEEFTSNYREILRNAMGIEYVNSDASPRRLADVAAGTSEDFTKREKRTAEMQTDVVEMKIS